MNMSRRETMQLSATALAALSFTAIRTSKRRGPGRSRTAARLPGGYAAAHDISPALESRWLRARAHAARDRSDHRRVLEIQGARLTSNSTTAR